MLYSNFRGFPNQVTFVQKDQSVNFYGLLVPTNMPAENQLPETESKETVLQFFTKFQSELRGCQSKLMDAIKYDSKS